jgi:hypothetical protein
MALEPRNVVELLEATATLPAGSEERFNGYAIMGMPFASGHVLALRRFPASSIGPGYTSVWLRDPMGRWTFYSDVNPHTSCSRYFADARSSVERGPIRLKWSNAWELTIGVPAARLVWDVQLAESPATRALNRVATVLPAPLWRWSVVLTLMASVAGRALDAGQFQFFGLTPNAQRFRANPGRLWVIEKSRALIGDIDAGEPAPLREQARLGDFLIPQRGIFVIGSSFIEPYGEGYPLREKRDTGRQPKRGFPLRVREESSGAQAESERIREIAQPMNQHDAPAIA